MSRKPQVGRLVEKNSRYRRQWKTKSRRHNRRRSIDKEDLELWDNVLPLKMMGVGRQKVMAWGRCGEGLVGEDDSDE